MGDPSRWATPVAPDRWFDAGRLERSRAYHAPLARAVLVRLGAQASLLLLVCLAHRLGEHPAAAAGYVETALSGVLVAAALWIPRLLTDTWMEFRHEPRFGGSGVSFARFALVSSMSTAGVFGLGAAVAVIFADLTSTTRWWPVASIAGLALVSYLTGPAAARSLHRVVPLDAAIESELQLVADAGGVGDVRWGRLDASLERGLNAVSFAAVGRRGREGATSPLVACSEELLLAEPDLRDFVVAHEVAHLRRGHHTAAFVVSLLGMSFEVSGLWAFDRWVLDPAGYAVTGARGLPVAVAVLAVLAVPVGLIEAWRSRSHERQADNDAVANVGVPPIAALRSLHEHDRSDLDPGLLARCFARHPAPAERLLLAARVVGSV